jgi:hypothetical protein
MSNLQWERGQLNPTMFAIVKDVLQSAGVELRMLLTYSYTAFAAYAVFLCLGTFLIFRKTRIWKNRQVLLLVSIFLYVLVMPRFKDYSYILLIVPSILVIKDMVRVQALQWMVVLAVCIHVTTYQSLFGAMLLFLFLLGGLSKLLPTYSFLSSNVSNRAVP